MPTIQRYTRVKSKWESFQAFQEILYISALREFRTSTGGRIVGMALKFARPLLLLAIFWVIYELIGRLPAIRGDFFLWLLTGIFLYLAHIQAVSQIKGKSGAQAGMMFFAKTSSLIDIASTALIELYILAVSIIVILFVVFLVRGELDIYRPAELLGPLFIAWASGLAVGMLFMALTPIFPLAPMLFGVYRRLQMFTSGKMFVANSIPLSTLPFFEWNPLFHAIDQARGAAFINYTPMRTNMEYPVNFTITVMVIALVISFANRARQDRGIE